MNEKQKAYKLLSEKEREIIDMATIAYPLFANFPTNISVAKAYHTTFNAIKNKKEKDIYGMKKMVDKLKQDVSIIKSGTDIYKEMLLEFNEIKKKYLESGDM